MKQFSTSYKSVQSTYSMLVLDWKEFLLFSWQVTQVCPISALGGAYTSILCQPPSHYGLNEILQFLCTCTCILISSSIHMSFIVCVQDNQYCKGLHEQEHWHKSWTLPVKLQTNTDRATLARCTESVNTSYCGYTFPFAGLFSCRNVDIGKEHFLTTRGA